MPSRLIDHTQSPSEVLDANGAAVPGITRSTNIGEALQKLQALPLDMSQTATYKIVWESNVVLSGIDAVVDTTPVEPDLPPPPPVEPEPAEPPPPVQVGMIPLPAFDVGSANWASWMATIARYGGDAYDDALIYAATGDESFRLSAIEKAQAVVDADTVAGNQYLRAQTDYADVFATMAWCSPPAEQADAWAAWGNRHLGATDGSIGDRGFAIWWKRRWSRNNPANNYYHSFLRATSLYVMATGDQEWMDYLKSDRIPLMYAYYNQSPDGGSREGTGYGESHRGVFSLAKMWRDYDGTEIVPQTFIDGSISYWVHATAPSLKALSPIGDQTRAKGKIDGFHCDVIDNLLEIAKDRDAIALGRWHMGQLLAKGLCFSSHVFRDLILRDYEESPMPEGIPLAYHAEGAGVLFVRDSWTDDATYMFFLAGIHDEAHQHDDQGAFAVWADGQWQTISDSPWNGFGIDQGVEHQNVVRFPSATNIRHSAGVLDYTIDDGALTVDMDLSESVGESWVRVCEWRFDNTLRIVDTFDNDAATFGFEKPSADDERPRFEPSIAVAVTERTETGFDSIVSW